MIGTFNFYYNVEIRELLCKKYNKNKSIDKQMAYTIDGDIKYDIT